MDRDVIGALQFVAKAIELWFLFIACNLVYNIVIRYARSGKGTVMMTRYLFPHDNLAYPGSPFHPSFWKAAWQTRISPPSQRKKPTSISLWYPLSFYALLPINRSCRCCPLDNTNQRQGPWQPFSHLRIS